MNHCIPNKRNGSRFDRCAAGVLFLRRPISKPAITYTHRRHFRLNKQQKSYEQIHSFGISKWCNMVMKFESYYKIILIVYVITHTSVAGIVDAK